MRTQDHEDTRPWGPNILRTQLWGHGAIRSIHEDIGPWGHRTMRFKREQNHEVHTWEHRTFRSTHESTGHLGPHKWTQNHEVHTWVYRTIRSKHHQNTGPLGLNIMRTQDLEVITSWWHQSMRFVLNTGAWDPNTMRTQDNEVQKFIRRNDYENTRPWCPNIMRTQNHEITTSQEYMIMRS